MQKYRYDERKATQAAAVILKSAGGRYNYMALIKLLYIANREALRRWGVPIAPDKYVSMNLGPVLSGVLNSINEPPFPGSETYWSTVIDPPTNYEVMLRGENPDDGELSDREVALLTDTFHEFRHMNPWQLVDYCHDNLPEWEDPEGSSIPISVEAILTAIGYTPAQIEELVEDEESFRAEDEILSR